MRSGLTILPIVLTAACGGESIRVEPFVAEAALFSNRKQWSIHYRKLAE